MKFSHKYVLLAAIALGIMNNAQSMKPQYPQPIKVFLNSFKNNTDKIIKIDEYLPTIEVVAGKATTVKEIAKLLPKQVTTFKDTYFVMLPDRKLELHFTIENKYDPYLHVQIFYDRTDKKLAIGWEARTHTRNYSDDSKKKYIEFDLEGLTNEVHYYINCEINDASFNDVRFTISPHKLNISSGKNY